MKKFKRRRYFLQVVLLPKVWLCFMSVLFFHPGKGQDIHFSQFFEAPLLRNPSLAGIFTGDIRIQGVYRDQWSSFTNAYKSGSFNFEYKMPVGHSDDFLTTGLQVLYDKAGTVGLRSTHILPAINYHKSLSSEKQMYLSLGFMGGLVNNGIDQSKITSDQQYSGGSYNPSLAHGENFSSAIYNYFDASFGTSFNSSFGTNEKNSLYFGAAFHHINRPNHAFYRSSNAALHPKYVFSAGVKYTLTDYTFFTLQADYSQQGKISETIGGALYSIRIGEPEEPGYILHAGGFLRWKDALIPVIKIDYNPFAVAVSYDVNVSSLKTVSQGRGGFELSVSYVGFLDRNNSSRDKVLCPRF